MIDPDRGLARWAVRTLGRSGRLDRVASGLDTTYRFRGDDGELLAVRVGGPLPIRRPGALLAEAAWMARVHSSDYVQLVVPEVLRFPGSGPVLTVTDAGGRARAVMAVRWLRGRRARSAFGPVRARALGAAAARLHQDGRTFRLPEGGWLKTWDDSLMAGAGDLAALAAVAGESVGLTVGRVQRRLSAAIDDLGAEGFGAINADLGPHNTVWSRGRPGLVDFNDTGWGYFAFDLARFLRGLAGRSGGEVLVEAALDGYRQVAETPEGWAEHGRLFGAAADLFLARYLAPHVARRGPETAGRVRRLVATAAEVVDALT